MAFDAAFLTMMTETCTIYTLASTDKYGKRTRTAGTTQACRIERADQYRYSDQNGRTIRVDVRVYMPEQVAVTPDDEILLPDGTYVRVMNVQHVYDEEGVHHTKVLYGDQFDTR